MFTLFLLNFYTECRNFLALLKLYQNYNANCYGITIGAVWCNVQPAPSNKSRGVVLVQFCVANTTGANECDQVGFMQVELGLIYTTAWKMRDNSMSVYCC